MCRKLYKKVALFVLVSCAISISLTGFIKLSSPNVLQMEIHERQEDFPISESTINKFVYREQDSDEESSHKSNQQTRKTNTTIHEKKKIKAHSQKRKKEKKEKINNEVVDEKKAQENVVDKTAGQNTTNWCPEKSPYLVGVLPVRTQDIALSVLLESFPEITLGGRLRPKECVSRQRLAIIIPYRNRWPHLRIMLNNLIPFLKRQQVDATFFVIEQVPPETFNRGALLNIGFLEADKIARFDCYIFHDVDMIPLNDNNLYKCEGNPRHFAVAMNKFGYKMFYPNYFGAVVGFTREQYLLVNGCSNIYFGWGGEDDDLLQRVGKKNMTALRYDMNTSRYDMIKHKRDSGNEINLIRRALRKNARVRQEVEGLNSIKYQLNYIHIEKLYTWISVTLNKTVILQSAPKLTQEIIKTELAKLQVNVTLKATTKTTTVNKAR